MAMALSRGFLTPRPCRLPTFAALVVSCGMPLVGHKILDMSPMNGSARVLKLASFSKEVSSSEPATLSKATVTKGTLSVSNGKASASSVADRLGPGLPRIVVTGVACGLPGQPKVFEEDNLARLLSGQDCLEKLSHSSIAALVEKNVVQVKTVNAEVSWRERVGLSDGERQGLTLQRYCQVGVLDGRTGEGSLGYSGAQGCNGCT